MPLIIEEFFDAEEATLSIGGLSFLPPNALLSAPYISRQASHTVNTRQASI